jgi:hypothetical protein
MYYRGIMLRTSVKRGASGVMIVQGVDVEFSVTDFNHFRLLPPKSIFPFLA